MSMHPVWAVAAGALLSSACSPPGRAVPAEVVDALQSTGLTVELRLEPEYLAGAPIVVDVVLTNASGATSLYGAPTLGSSGSAATELVFDVRATGGRRLDPRAPTRARASTDADFVAVPPRRSVTHAVDLADAYAVRAAGDYLVTATYQNAAAWGRGGVDAWVGEVRSEPTRLRVLDPEVRERAALAVYEGYSRAAQAFFGGEPGTALRLDEECLAATERAVGADHPLVAVCLHHLAWHHRRSGEHRRAEDHERREEAIVSNVLRSRRPWAIADHYFALYERHGDVGPTVEAARLYDLALARLEQTQGPDAAALVHVLTRLAELRLVDAEVSASLVTRDAALDAAEALLERALSLGDTDDGAPPDLAAARDVLERVRQMRAR